MKSRRRKHIKHRAEVAAAADTRTPLEKVADVIRVELTNVGQQLEAAVTAELEAKAILSTATAKMESLSALSRDLGVRLEHNLAEQVQRAAPEKVTDDQAPVDPVGGDSVA